MSADPVHPNDHIVIDAVIGARSIIVATVPTEAPPVSDFETVDREGLCVVDRGNHREYVYRRRRYYCAQDAAAPEPCWRIYFVDDNPPLPELVEVDKWIPNPDKPGYMKLAGRMTVHELMDTLNERLRTLKLEPDEYGFTATLARYEGWLDTAVPACRWIVAFPVTGGSEGHYVHVGVLIPPEHRGPVEYKGLFLAKTFQGYERACAIANAVSQMLS